MSNILPVKKQVLISFASKGGVGKTTLVGNTGGALADMGQKVLMIDADHQGSLTSFYTRRFTAEHGFTKFVTSQDSSDCISSTDIEGLDIICNDDFNKDVSAWLKQSPSARASALRIAIKPLRDQYDYILIDCKGEDVTGEIGEMAVRAADMMISPVSPDALVVREFANNAMQVMERLAPLDPDDTINAVPIPHVCIYRYNPNSKAHSVYMDGLREMLSGLESDGKIITLNTEIPATVAYNDAQISDPRSPVHRVDFKRRSKQKLPSAYESMVSLIHELFPELSDLQPRRSPDEPLPQRTENTLNVQKKKAERELPA